jgi:iron complex outermembrane recepter protein
MWAVDRRRQLIAVAIRTVLGVTTVSAATAMAQTTTTTAPPTAAPQGVEEVVVTGFRQSLSLALDEKRDAIGAVDAIVAEDIADFPDLNLAESIQRIPGVSIERDAGEGKRISVRGLGPQFTRIRINGMEALTTGGGSDNAGGTNRDRSFDFNTFASELFNSITVRKTAAAEVEEGSLGATVDLQVARPFDYNGMTFVTGGQLGYNDLGEDADPRGTLLISNTFLDDRLGALMSVAYTKRKLLDEGASTVRFQNTPQSAANPAAGPFQSVAPGVPFTNGELGAAFRPRIPRYDIFEHEQERLGVTASLQFRPSEATLFTFDALYADFDAERDETYLESPNFSASLAQVDVLEAEIRQDGVDRAGTPVSTLVFGRFNDVDIRAERRHDELETKFTQFTLDGSHAISDAVTVHGLVGRSKSEHDNPEQTTLLFDINDVDNYVFDFRGSSRRPLISYGNADLTNPEAFTLTQIRLRPQTADNTFTNYMGDVTWQLNETFTVKGGAQLKKYEFETTDRRRASEGVTTAQALVPRSQYSELAKLQLNVPAGTPTRFIVPDLDAAKRVFNFDDPTLFPLSDQVNLGGNFAVEEEDTGVFAQVEMRTEVGGIPLRGNLGVRYVETDQQSTGLSRAATGVLSTTVDQKYNNTLPSLNLVAELTDQFLVRFGAAKVLARAGLGNLNPGATVQIAGNNKQVAAGNPSLTPFKADAFDLSFEWYFAKDSLLGIALFYKDIASFVQTLRATGPFSSNPLGLDDSVGIAVCDAQLPGAFDPNNATDVANCLADWQFSLPRNTPGGELTGVEISYQQPFTFLPGFWSNFGTLLNFTYVESEILYLNADGTAAFGGEKQDLTGLSKNAANATLYFDNGTFSARVSAAYRDEYLTTAPGRNGNDVEGTAESTTVDFAASYSLNENFTLTLEGLNLTDEFQDQAVDSLGNRLSYFHHTGRQYFVGGRYRF